MKFYYLILHIVFISSLSAYSQSNNDAPEIITKDFMTWWTYNSLNINFSQKYKAFDAHSKAIDKEIFLKTLLSGNYIPIRLSTHDNLENYKLHKLGPQVDQEIKTQIKEIAKTEFHYYKMEKTELPNFNFIDLNGNVYNKETTKGKYVVLKTWFIHCQKCIEEMPALNKAIKQFTKRNDVLFVSLAYDSKQKLNEFLKKHEFNYAVVSDKQPYLLDTLQIFQSPTHLIIKDGIILKVAGSNYEDMITYLEESLK